jgi:hypothetical protein
MKEHNDMAEALQLELHQAAQVIKLAALASETKRVLLDIEGMLEFHPELRELLRANIKHRTAWMAQDDTIAHVLELTADRIAEASCGLLDLAFKRSMDDREVQA